MVLVVVVMGEVEMCMATKACIRCWESTAVSFSLDRGDKRSDEGNEGRKLKAGGRADVPSHL